MTPDLEGILEMSQRVEHNPLQDALAVLLDQGLDGAGEALRILVDEASKIERSHFLNAHPYERSADRLGGANGFKPKTMKTRMGEPTLAVPQVREGGFYPSALEKGSRTGQAVNLMLAEMYVQGVSTRKVIEVLQRLIGPEVPISSTQVSRATEQNSSTRAWRRGASGRWGQPRTSCSTLATSGYAKPVRSSIARSWRLWASPPTASAGCWGCRYREIKRRTRVAAIFPNPASCLRLVSALLAETDQDWLEGKIYLNMKLR